MVIANIINNNGNAVKNQFIIIDNNILTFQSYNTIICTFDTTTYTLTVGNKWNFSPTTLKNFYVFLEKYCKMNEFILPEVKNFIKNGGVIKKEKINSYTIIKDF